MSMPDPILYLAAKTKPLARVAADGTFVLTLLAFRPVKAHCKHPWRLMWSGPAAQEFWSRCGAKLVPGVQLVPSIAEPVAPFDAGGRLGGAEIHAVVSAIQINPKEVAPCTSST